MADMKNLSNEKFLKIIKNLCKKNNKKDIKILDWGCGRGDLVKFLNDQGYDCYGLEIETNSKIINQLNLDSNKDIYNKLSFIKDDNITKFNPPTKLI